MTKKRKAWNKYLPYLHVDGTLINEIYEINLLIPKTMHPNTFKCIDYDCMISPFENEKISLTIGQSKPYMRMKYA